MLCLEIFLVVTTGGVGAPGIWQAGTREAVKHPTVHRMPLQLRMTQSRLSALRNCFNPGRPDASGAISKPRELISLSVSRRQGKENPALLGLVVQQGLGLHVSRKVGRSQAADSGTPLGTVRAQQGRHAPAGLTYDLLPVPLPSWQVQRWC